MPYIIIGKIFDPEKGKERREITVENKLECGKLPLDKYPVTRLIKPEGIGITLRHGEHECEASLHRYEKAFYIGSATKRLGPTDYAEEFRRFLERAGVIDPGTLVRLKFEGYRIDVEGI